MTVREHLQFYGRLKGNMSSKELDRDINEYVLINLIYGNIFLFLIN
jgi:ABC-type multidrug transport system ATPase subunit